MGKFKKGMIPWNKGKPSILKGIPRTQEVKDKVSKANKGKISWIKGKTFEEVYGEEKAKIMKDKLSRKAVKQFTGKKLPKEHCENIAKGNAGRTFSQETKDKISASHIGKKSSLKTKQKLSKHFTGRPNLKARGENSGSWKGGITPLIEKIRHSVNFKIWRNKVFQRDEYICQECFVKGRILNPHHKKRFYIIVSEFLKEYDQFSPIEDKETLFRLAEKYESFWDISNGITLCQDCHNIEHKGEKYGKATKNK